MENLFQDVLFLTKTLAGCSAYFFIVAILRLIAFSTEDDIQKKPAKRKDFFEYLVMFLFTFLITLLLSLSISLEIIILLTVPVVILGYLVLAKTNHFYLIYSVFMFVTSGIAILTVIAFISHENNQVKYTLISALFLILFSKFCIDKMHP